MPTQEHVIALVSKLEDRASAEFPKMAAAAEQAAHRIDSAMDNAGKSIAELISKRDAAMQRATSLGRVDVADFLKGSTNAPHIESMIAVLDKHEAALKRDAAAMRDATESGSAFGDMLLSVGSGIAAGVGFAAFNIVSQAIGNLITSIPQLAQEATALAAFADSASLTADALQDVAVVSERANVPIQSVASAMRILAKQVTNDSPALRELGIATRDADGSFRSLWDVLRDLANVYATTSDATAKTTLATKLMGETGAQLVPILNKGADGMAAIATGAEKAGRKLDEDAIAQLQRLDTQLAELRDKWSGFTISVRLAIVRAFGDPSEDPELKREQERAARVNRIQSELIAREPGGGVSDAARYREIRLEAERLYAAELKLAEAAREKANAKLREAAGRDPEADAREAAGLERQIAALENRIRAGGLGRDKVDELAVAFSRGAESVRSLYLELRDASAVERIVERSRVMLALQQEYGDSWRIVDELSRSQTEHAQSTEEALQRAADAMARLVREAEKLDKVEALKPKGQDDKGRWTTPDRPDLRPGDPVPRPSPAEPGGGPIPADVWERIAEMENVTNRVSDALNGMISGMTATFDREIDNWTEKVIKFGGTFGDVFRDMVSEGLKQLERLLLAKALQFLLQTFTGGGGGAGGLAPITAVAPAIGPEFAAALLVGSQQADRVSRGTVVNLNVSALDLGTMTDRSRSVFGTLRQAIEDAADTGIYGGG